MSATDEYEALDRLFAQDRKFGLRAHLLARPIRDQHDDLAEIDSADLSRAATEADVAADWDWDEEDERR